MRTVGLWVVLAAVFVAATSVAADSITVINAQGVTPFVYSGYSYVPLKSTADFLGAGLLWDSLHNRATVTYRNRELGLVIGSTTAYYGGQTVLLPVPPVVVEQRLLVPVIVFERYFDVPVRWEPDYDRVLILGPPGWGYYHVLPYTPPHAITVIRGYGPPPWAPAHGYRHHYATVYVPAPFVYYGATYIPLRDVTDFIGAALLWDSLRNRAVITYSGREIALVIGSPTVYYGTQVIVLPAPPVIVGGHVYVPSTLLDRHMNIPVSHHDGVLKIKGAKGWRDFHVASSPPGHVYAGEERKSEFGLLSPSKPLLPRASQGWMSTRDREPADAGRHGVWARPEQRPSGEPGRGSASSMKQKERPTTSAKPSSGQKPAPKPAPSKKDDDKPKKSSGNKGGGFFKAKDKAKNNK